MEHSDFGKRFAGEIGIGELMDDLGNALSADPAPLMLGGGNPSHVPEVQALFRQRMELTRLRASLIFPGISRSAAAKCRPS